MSDSILQSFSDNNPHAKVSYEANEFTIETPWGLNDCRISFTNDNEKAISDLNYIIINPRLDAIIHADTGIVEFAYAFLHKESSAYKNHAKREFTVVFNNLPINCKFSKPSDRFTTLAHGFHPMPSESGNSTMPQMMAFHDFAKLDKLNERNKDYFINREPINFFIELHRDIGKFDLIKLCRSINFIMQTYDRETPLIMIRDIKKTEEMGFSFKQCIRDTFPNNVIIRDYDDTLLKLVEVAINSGPREAFLYYYQIFEYAGFYYTDYKTRNSLLKLLKDPCIISCCDDKIDQFIDLFSENNNNEDVKIRKVIEEKCDASEIWIEMENDKTFFTEEHFLMAVIQHQYLFLKNVIMIFGILCGHQNLLITLLKLEIVLFMLVKNEKIK